MKVICQNVGDLGTPEKAQASGIMTIPTRCVLSVERLTEEGGIIYFSVGSGSVGSGSVDSVGSGDSDFERSAVPAGLTQPAL
jgi:hypothetical protein